MTIGMASPLYPIADGAGNARTSQCACGDWINAIADDDGMFLAVRSHRSTRRHQAWLAREIGAGRIDGTPAFPRGPLPLRAILDGGR